ncbi:MAG: HEAT repeat domain-containing protein [Planctomycetales bacterium]|nr:HEAT repeat domain-containing protein [Planctomycetales bacterium]
MHAFFSMRPGQLWLISMLVSLFGSSPVWSQSTNEHQISYQSAHQNGIQFDILDGLKLEVASTNELVHWPIMADWDPQGRLVVVESGGTSKPIVEHNKLELHRIVRLLDDDHDGVFDRRILAAEKLPFCEGVLSISNYLLVAAPPHILKLTDSDGDGYCEQREIWFDGQTITGCANDLHGPYLGRDGWVYWCKGAFAEQTHDLLGGGKLLDSAAHIHRRHLSGGPIEPVMSGGMDNPVETVSTPEGERFFTSTFLQHPGDGLRDGIAHTVLGSVHGKDQRAIVGLPRTGPLLPITVHLGPAAPSGLDCLPASWLPNRQLTSFPADGSMLVASQFNMHKVSGHVLVPKGGSYETLNLDLLRTEQIDFHPTDIIQCPDGSLLVIDTGGWYDLCCPTSRVDQKTASGGLYRLRVSSSDGGKGEPQNFAAWQATSSENCVEYIDDPRPWVARAALLQLASSRSKSAIDQLKQRLQDQQSSVSKRLSALWALSSIGDSNALSIIASALTTDSPESIQHAACHAVSLHRFGPALPRLVELANSTSSPQIARAVSESIGRIGNKACVVVLMDLLGRFSEIVASDIVLAHSITYALMELKTTEEFTAYLQSPHDLQRLVALRVLFQLDGPASIPADYLSDALLSANDNLATLARDILAMQDNSSPATFTAMSKVIDQRLGGGQFLQPLLAAWREHPETLAWATEQLHNTSLDNKQNFSLFHFMNGEELPAAWVDYCCRNIVNNTEATAAWLSGMKLDQPPATILVREIQERLAAETDVSVLEKLLRCLPTKSKIADPLLAHLLEKGVSLGALERLELSPSQAQTVLELIDTTLPRDLVSVIGSIASAADDSIDVRLFSKLLQIPAARTLAVDQVNNIYRHRSATLRESIKSTMEQLSATPKDIEVQVQTLLSQLPQGNAARGLQVFRSAKATCSACHRMGYLGNNIGPDLTRIGSSRTREALLEAMVFPSARLEQSYQPWKILTADGNVYNGLIKRADESEVELQLSADKSIRISRHNIEREEPSSVSIMPTGIAELLTPQEIADVLECLQAAR